ncbi:MAG: TRAP transporter small permease [Dehalococcoidales bacterium]|nr:TRAP transporter small permease [Dehalococcoidales bacterium]
MEKRSAKTSLISIVDSLATGGAGAAAACVLLMTAIVGVSVFSRYVLNSPLIFADELTSYLMVATVFLGLAYVARKEGNIRIDFIINHVPARVRRIAEIVFLGLGIILIAALFFGSFRSTIDLYHIHAKTPTVLAAPLFLLQMFIPLGWMLLLLQLIAKLYKRLKSPAIDESTSTSSQVF